VFASVCDRVGFSAKQYADADEKVPEQGNGICFSVRVNQTHEVAQLQRYQSKSRYGVIQSRNITFWRGEICLQPSCSSNDLGHCRLRGFWRGTSNVAIN
jgi:hypothetical protein